MPRQSHSWFAHPNNIRLKKLGATVQNWVAQTIRRPEFVHPCNCPVRFINPSTLALASSWASRSDQTMWRIQSYWLTGRRMCIVPNCRRDSHSTGHACGWWCFSHTAHHLHNCGHLIPSTTSTGRRIQLYFLSHTQECVSYAHIC
jgi:hypothetical protein